MEGDKAKKEHKEPKVSEKIDYSEKYYDEKYEYRHVILPKDLGKHIPSRLLSEMEWRSFGIQQSRGWEHYTLHRPEPHILLFRRPHGTDPATGVVDPFVAACAKKDYLESLDAYHK